MVRIAISVEAFEAIARTLPLGTVGYEAEVNERGERVVWLGEVWVDRLGAMRGPASPSATSFCGWSKRRAHANQSSPSC